MLGRGRPGNHQAKIARLGGVVQTQEVRLLPPTGKSKGRPRRERLFLPSQAGLKQSRGALPRPDAGTGVRDAAETQRRRLPRPVWRGGRARGAFWSRLGGCEPRLEPPPQSLGGCPQRAWWVSPPRPRGHHLRPSRRQVKGRWLGHLPCDRAGAQSDESAAPPERPSVLTLRRGTLRRGRPLWRQG